MQHVTDAIAQLRAMIAAAERGEPRAVAGVVAAATAPQLRNAVRLVLPEIRQSISAGDGRFTADQVAVLEAALKGRPDLALVA